MYRYSKFALSYSGPPAPNDSGPIAIAGMIQWIAGFARQGAVVGDMCYVHVQGRWTTWQRRSERWQRPAPRSPTRSWRRRCAVRRAARCWPASTYTTTSRTRTMTTARPRSGDARTSRTPSPPTSTTPDTAPVAVAVPLLLCRGYNYDSTSARRRPFEGR